VTDAILTVKNLSVSFRQDGAEVRAVRGVSYDVGRGETVAIVGESGSGKSVTALSTVSLLPDSATVTGSIRYMGDEMVGASESTLRKMRGNRISFIFQEPMTSLNPLHTLEKQLAESLLIHQGLTGSRRATESSSFCTRSASRTPRRVSAPIRTSCRAGSGSG
jgi:microcin C transport system ATP-binding protein